MITITKSEVYKYLKHGDETVTADKQAFQWWERKEISDLECLRKFRRNNQFPDDVLLPEDEFLKWLRSEGWR